MTNESTVTRRREGGGAASQTEAHSKTGDVTFRPPLDLYDFDDRYEALFDIPGTTTENIDVTVHDGVLTVEACVEPRYPGHITPMLGEFGVGDFRRQVRHRYGFDHRGVPRRGVDAHAAQAGGASAPEGRGPRRVMNPLTGHDPKGRAPFFSFHFKGGFL